MTRCAKCNGSIIDGNCLKCDKTITKKKEKEGD